MLYVFYGADTPAVRQKALAKASDEAGNLLRIEADRYERGQLLNVVGGTSLFGGERTILIDTPSANAELYEEAMKLAGDMASLAETCIVIEPALKATEVKVWAKAGAICEESGRPEAARFNTFSLADALALKDKKSLWLLLCEAKMNGLYAEEIIRTLWWQLKTLRLAMVTTSANEAGMKDYPYNKAKRSLRNFKDDELERLSHSLIAVYHAARVGEKEMMVGLEEWVLRI